MTEAGWQTCEDWRQMLAFLSGRWTSRKATLYLCAGLRSLWDLLYNEGSRGAVAVAERAADGLASEREMREAYYWAESPTFGYDFDPEFVRKHRDKEGYFSQAVCRLMEMGVYTEEDVQSDQRLGEERIRFRLENAARIAYHSRYARYEGGDFPEHFLEFLTAEAEWPEAWLVREVVGNPFCSVMVNSAWLAWNEGTVVRIAQALYDDRAFDRMPILADALEDAGCDNADILNHCREPGEHVRDCWVVDLLLGKE